MTKDEKAALKAWAKAGRYGNDPLKEPFRDTILAGLKAAAKHL